MSNLPFTLDQLKILQTISKEGSFKKAAEKLYISQPAVSLQIQNLEKQLNTAIFYRDKRKAYLTENGKLLKKYCDKIINLCEETCQALDELKNFQSNTLTIGASQTTGTYLMPRLIGLFRHTYPYINIELRVESTPKISLAVINKDIALAVIGGKIPKEHENQLEITKYAEDELALILPVSHPFTALDCIRKEDLYRLRFITLSTNSSTIQNVIESRLMEYGIDINYLRIEMELNSIEAVKNAVQTGLGAAFVSISAISKELDLGMLHCSKIEGITIKKTLSIITNKKIHEGNLTKLFKKEMLSMFGSPPTESL